MEPLEHRIRRLMKLHPPLREGALSWRGLIGLAQRVTRRLDLDCSVKLRPCPYGGSVGRIGPRVTYTIDSRADRDQRRRILAHEIGHVALGHYALEDEVWYYTDDPQDDPYEGEADLFEAVALRSRYWPVEHIIRPEQLGLRLHNADMDPGLRRVWNSYKPSRVRTAGEGKPRPDVERLLLRLFD